MIRSCLYTLGQAGVVGDIDLIDRWRNEGGFLWLDIQKSIDRESEALLASFQCHELAISDVRRERHPPKLEEFAEHSFVIFRGVEKIDDNLNHIPLQISCFAGPNYLITVHAKASLSVNYHFEQLAETCKLEPRRLMASLMHYSCGRYLESLLNFDSILVEMEDNMLNQGSDSLLKDLVRYRSQLRKMRRTFTYHEKLSEELIELWDVDDDHPEFSHSMRNLYDRCERLSSLSAQHYEICGDLVDGYFSLTSHQLNNTMRILTVITAIFVPLSFLAGLYGMNFEYIPELHIRSGYFILLGVMVTMAATMVFVFKKKNWF